MIQLASHSRSVLLLTTPLALLLTGSAGATDPEPEAVVVAPEAIAAAVARPAYRVVLERNGEVFGIFQTVSGLISEHDVVEYREGSDDTGIVRKIPGRLTFGDVSLSRRLISMNLDAWQWRREVEIDFEGARSDVTIRLVDRQDDELAVWHLTNAWPAKVTGPSPKSDGNGIAIETLELAHEGFQRIK